MTIRRRSNVALVALAMSAGLLVAGCTAAAEEPAAETATDTTETAASGPDFSTVQVALVPGGAHPYFQPWIAGGEAGVAEFGIHDLRLIIQVSQRGGRSHVPLASLRK